MQNNDVIELNKKLTRSIKELSVLKDKYDIVQRDHENLIMKFSNKEREVK